MAGIAALMHSTRFDALFRSDAPPSLQHLRIQASNMTNLEVLLLKGSKQGDPAVNLEDLRYEVLVNGVPSKTDGMVRS